MNLSVHDVGKIRSLGTVVWTVWLDEETSHTVEATSKSIAWYRAFRMTGRKPIRVEHG